MSETRAVHAPDAKSNPVSQVAATLFVADVHVTVAALRTAVHVVHSSVLSHVPALQVAAALSVATGLQHAVTSMAVSLLHVVATQSVVALVSS